MSIFSRVAAIGRGLVAPFSTINFTKIPDGVAEMFRKKAKEKRYFDVAKINRADLLKMHHEMSEIAHVEAAEGSKEAQEFLGKIKVEFDDLTQFKSDLITKEEDGYCDPEEERAVMICAAAIAAAKNQRLKDISIDIKGTTTRDLTGHTDFDEEGIDFLAMVCFVSQGKVRTFAINIDQILEKIPASAKDILFNPVFKHEKHQDVRPILFGGKDGAINVNFNYGYQPILKECAKHRVNFDEAKSAVQTFIGAIEEIIDTGKVVEFFFKPGDITFFNNKRVVHGRSPTRDEKSGKPLDPDRQLAVMSFSIPKTKISFAQSEKIVEKEGIGKF